MSVNGEEFAIFSAPLEGNDVPQAPLTTAESAIVDLVLRGYSNTQIASARGTTARTVANQLATIYRKLGIGSRKELMVLWGRNRP